MPGERTGPVAGVVLAAGTSSRMGENKLLFRVEGETLVRRAVQTALSAGLEPVIVVLGHEAERAIAELSGLEIEPVFNDEYARGIHTSLKTGIAAVPAGLPPAAWSEPSAAFGFSPRCRRTTSTS